MKRLCDVCGATAQFTDGLQDTRKYPDELCEECAHVRGAERSGEGYAALRALGFAVAILREVGLTDEDIRAALGRVLTRPEVDDSYPVGGDAPLACARHDTWRRTIRPLEAAA